MSHAPTTWVKSTPGVEEVEKGLGPHRVRTIRLNALANMSRKEEESYSNHDARESQHNH